MPKEEENKGGEGGEGGGQEPKIDAFGAPDTPPTPPKKEGEGEGKKEKKFAQIPDDHPTIVALKGEIEKVKNEYGGNLAGQRTVIEGLSKKIEELTKGKGGGEGEADVLFKDIKRSKDLTPEQREEMTETEIRQMDEIADMKEAQNKMYAEQQKRNKEGGETKVQDLQGWVKGEARELARGKDGQVNTELANQIIEASKMFNFEGLDEEKVRERVRAAATHVPSYKPPKEQVKKDGKTVSDADKGGEDPFGNNAIVESVQKKKKEGSFTL